MRRVLLLAISVGLFGFVTGCYCIHGVCDCDPNGLHCTGAGGCAGCAGTAGGHLAPVAATSVVPVGPVHTLQPEPIKELPKPVDPDKGGSDRTSDSRDRE
jgi:hypothetical protein